MLVEVLKVLNIDKNTAYSDRLNVLVLGNKVAIRTGIASNLSYIAR